MPTEQHFAQVPPFPSDIPLVPLPRISLQKLQDGNSKETSLLYEACREWGFFLLNLADAPAGKSVLDEAEKMFGLVSDTFALDQDTLDQYAYKPPTDLTGYKQKGKLKTDDGKMDCMELYSINQDDMLGNVERRVNAPPIETHRNDIENFIEKSHNIASIVFSQLDQQLGLPGGTLASLSSLDEPSATSVRLLQAQSGLPVQENDTITLGGHTDIGTLTILFNVVGGLQILPAGSENVMDNWRFVKPEPGYAIVNIGDTVVEWTGGLLRSSLHRVITAPGEQASVPRQSVAYLLRPRRSASMRRLQGTRIPPPRDGEYDERPVDEWAAWRTKQIIMGELKPQTRGGC